MHEVKLRGCVFYYIHICNNYCFRSANSVETGKKKLHSNPKAEFINSSTFI